MKVYNKLILVATFCCIMIISQSCSTSVLVDEWSDTSFNEAPLKKVFVIAIRKDPTKRRIWEDAFVAEFTQRGVKATPSYNLFPEALPDTNQVIETILDKGFDSILITRLLSSDIQDHYVEGYVTRELHSRYNNFRNRYDTYYRYVQHPGYMESEVIDRRAIDVWVIRDNGRMIWSATSNSLERNSVQAVQDDVAGLVLSELQRYAIIKSNR